MVVESNLHGGKGIVRGDQFSIRRTTTNVPPGHTVTSASLTLRQLVNGEISASGGLVFQKPVTPTNIPGTGQIENLGSSGVGQVRFDLQSADTLAMASEIEYSYDIQVGFSNGDLLTLERGLTSSLEENTVA